jgi:hypothetical protein
MTWLWSKEIKLSVKQQTARMAEKHKGFFSSTKTYQALKK